VAKKESEFISEAIDRFQRTTDAEVFIREDALISQKFARGDQWPDDIKQFREENNLPCLTINLMNTLINGMVGDVRQNMPSLKVRPVDNVADPKGALVLQEIIRNIENNNNAKAVYSKGFEQALESGYGFWRLRTEFNDNDSFDQDIIIESINNKFRVYFDQSAQKSTYEDAKWAFITSSMTRKEFMKKYPNKNPEPVPSEARGEEFESWYEDEVIRIAEYYWKEPVKGKKISHIRNAFGEEMVIDGDVPLPAGFSVVNTREVDSHTVMWTKISGTQILEEKIDLKISIIPIVPIIGDETDAEGMRKIYSLIYHAIDSQRMYNYNYTKEMERLGLAVKAKYLATKEQINGHNWDTAHTSNRPVQTYTHIPGIPKPEPIAPAVSSPGLLNQMAVAKGDIKETTGIFESNLGKSAPGVRAAVHERDLRIQGKSNTYKFIDNFLNAMVHTGKIMLEMIPQYYDRQRSIRVIGEGGENIVEINKVVIDPLTLEPIIINDLSKGKYDYVVEAGIYYLTKRQEAVASMMVALQFAPDFAPLILPMIAEQQDWPGADKLAQAMRQLTQGQQQQPGVQPGAQQQASV
jgi:hypothetical protein